MGSAVKSEITIDEHSERILLSGLSFDHVCLQDGYIQPCVEPFDDCLSQRDLTFVEPPQVEPTSPEVCGLKAEQQIAAESFLNDLTCACSDLGVAEEAKNSSPSASSSLRKKTQACRLNVERNLKKILRLFRKSLKRMFDEIHGKKHYYWSHLTLRKQTLSFFVE